MLTATPEADNGRWRLQQVVEAGARPVSAASVSAFRVAFGLLVTFSSIRFLVKGWVDTLYLQPENHLTYRWFEWVEPLPAPLMHLHMVMLVALGVAIAAGYRFRLASGLFAVAFVYTELIDAALYLNHYWFVTLVSVLFLLLPVHHHWSLDARSGRVQHADVVPAGVVWALRAQLGAVYIFAGVAKLNGDWLVRSQPMELWLSARSSTPAIGWLFNVSGVPLVMSWAGVVFDCTIVGFLLWRRSRSGAYVALVVFHLVTGLLFQIGVFPIVMILSTLVFFEPDWPQRFIGRSSIKVQPDTAVPRVGFSRTALLVAFAAVQIWLPLRHYSEPSNVRWSEEGYYLSWRVMLTEKAGFVEYEVTVPGTGERWGVDPSLVLTDWQRSVASTKPDLIHATALLIADHYEARGELDVEVRATAWISMNGRPAGLIIDHSIDLAAHARGDLPAGWILSLRSRSGS